MGMKMGVRRAGTWAARKQSACGAMWSATRANPRRLSGFADDDHDEKGKRNVSILERHASNELSTMFNLEPPSTADVGSGAAQTGPTDFAHLQQTDFAHLRQTQEGVSMGVQRRKAWQKFPDAHSGSAVVPRPRKIVLIRHAESVGNVDELVYTTTPDWKIPLTERGIRQADDLGDALRSLIGDGSVYIYHSPYVRTAQTTAQILLKLPQHQIKAVREEPRISEQQFGNLHHLESIRNSKVERKMYGRFFYRFTNGEAGLDVYSRISSFIGTLRRDHLEEDCTILIVTHGLALRLFLMRFFQWTVEQFEATHNPPNCGLALMERQADGRYSLSPASLEMMGAHRAPRMSSIGRNVFRRAFVDTFLSY